MKKKKEDVENLKGSQEILCFKPLPLRQIRVKSTEVVLLGLTK